MVDAGKKILIVEDEKYLLKALQDKFTFEGFTVLVAEDGQEGLKKALAERPDLILADIVMPKMDGISMIKQLREDDWGKNAKIIILTNLNPQDRVIQDLTQTQPAYYLMKVDTRLEEIIEKAKEVIRN